MATPFQVSPPPIEIPIQQAGSRNQGGMPNRWQQWLLNLQGFVAALGTLADLAAQTGLGFATRISTAGQWRLRTFQPGANIAITNPAGVAGDPSFSVTPQASAASELFGRGSAAGGGAWQEITLGAGLSMSGTVLDVSGTAGLTIAQVAARVALGI